MHRDDLYSYFLEVKGTPEEKNIVYQQLQEEGVIGDYLEPCEPENPPYSDYCYPQDQGAGSEWNEETMENLLHRIALQVPKATLEITGQNEDDQSYGFTKRFHGDLYQETKLVTYMPSMIEGGDVPFADRYNAPKHPRKMQVLCEEYEGSDGIREFTILGVSEDKEQLRRLMNAKIDKDEYGFIASNGVYDSRADHFQTEFNNGFVEYYIVEEDVLSRDKIEEMLQDREYKDNFQYSIGFRDDLTRALQHAAASHNLNPNRIDFAKAAEAIMENWEFRSEWKKHISGGRFPDFDYEDSRTPEEFCFDYCDSQIKTHRDYFADLGALAPGYSRDKTNHDSIIDEIMDLVRELDPDKEEDIGPNGGVGYTMPDGEHHIFIYLDHSEGMYDEDYFYVIEPNRVVDGAHDPMGDTYGARLFNEESIAAGLNWCMNWFGLDERKPSLASMIAGAQSRTSQPAPQQGREQNRTH